MEESNCDRSGASFPAGLQPLAGLALDLAQHEILWADGTGRLVYANRSACSALHYAREELLSITVGDIYPSLASLNWAHLWHALKTSGPVVLEVVGRTRSDKWRVWELSITHLQHDGKEYACIFGRDMDDWVAAEDKLTEEKNQLAAIIDTMQVGVLTVNPQGIITFANRRMARMFRFMLEDLIGSAYADHVHPVQLHESAEMMRRLINGDTDHVHHERRYIRGDGGDFWGHFSCRRLEDLRGNLVSLVGVIAHVSDMKKEGVAQK